MDEDAKMRKILASAKIAEPGLSQQQLMGVYKGIQQSDTAYEEIVQTRGYTGPAKTASVLNGLVKTEERGNYYILDVGAGTGLVGQELLKQGFTKIDGLEPSQDLAKDADDRGIYQTTFISFMTGERTKGLSDDSYDALVTCGCFMENHLPVDVLDEMIRVVKPRGLIVITTRYKYLTTVSAYKDKLEQYMTTLERRGKWEMITREIFPRYYMEDEGIVWTFRKK